MPGLDGAPRDNHNLLLHGIDQARAAAVAIVGGKLWRRARTALVHADHTRVAVRIAAVVDVARNVAADGGVDDCVCVSDKTSGDSKDAIKLDQLK